MRNRARHLDNTTRRQLELVPERALRGERLPYGIVDIGSNSVRLVIYDGLGRAPFPRFNEKSLCRLAAGLDETGELAADGFRRTVEALRRFSAIAAAMGVVRIDVLAKDASRAKNRIDKLMRQTPTALTYPVFYAVGGSWRAHAKVHMAATQSP